MNKDTKKAIRETIEDAIKGALLKFDASEPSKKTHKLLRSVSKKVAEQIKIDVKKKVKKKPKRSAKVIKKDAQN